MVWPQATFADASHPCRHDARRGHAAQHVIQLDGPDAALWQPTQLPASLRKARAHPEWSTLNPEASLAQSERQTLIDQLTSALHPT